MHLENGQTSFFSIQFAIKILKINSLVHDKIMLSISKNHNIYLIILENKKKLSKTYKSLLLFLKFS